MKDFLLKFLVFAPAKST